MCSSPFIEKLNQAEIESYVEANKSGHLGVIARVSVGTDIQKNLIVNIVIKAGMRKAHLS